MPLLIVNLNLPPTICTHLEHLICLGIAPGLHTPKDANSFFHPAYLECHRWYCSALESCFTVKDVHFDVVYFHKYRVPLRDADAGRCMNNRCTESLLVLLIQFRTVYGLGPNIW